MLIGEGFNGKEVKAVVRTLLNNRVTVDIVGERLGILMGADGVKVVMNETFTTTSPVLHDAIYVVGGNATNQAKFDSDIKEFINETYRHFKPIGVASTGEAIFMNSDASPGPGVVIASESGANFPNDFIQAITQQRFWNRNIYSN